MASPWNSSEYPLVVSSHAAWRKMLLATCYPGFDYRKDVHRGASAASVPCTREWLQFSRILLDRSFVEPVEMGQIPTSKLWEGGKIYAVLWSVRLGACTLSKTSPR